MNCAFHRLCVLSLGIASVVFLQTMLVAQTTTGLAIQVLEASAGQNLISHDTPPIKVRVLDRTGRAIPGADVLFVAPEEGPTGQFLPNESKVTVATDSAGIATAPRFRTNNTVGEYQIQVIASYRNAASRVVIPQNNVLKRKSSTRKIILFSALIGGAAVAALAARGGSTPVSPAVGAAMTPTVSVGGEAAVSLTPPVSVSPALIIAPQTDFTPVVTALPGMDISAPPLATSPVPSPAVQVVPPVPQAQLPTIPGRACADMPPTSNRQACR
ncbi:MAG TPA: hypothetical protein VFR18_00940 [Terriglobia bacterium]|nr:hypothetical protein [Terriglobia bacterium]